MILNCLNKTNISKCILNINFISKTYLLKKLRIKIKDLIILKGRKMKKKLTLFQLIALSVAFYGSIRNIPLVASAGWYSIFYMVGAAIFFAIPISLIAAELATGWPEEGGPQVWVKAALGSKWAFVTSWLLWVQMFFGMVMVSTAFAAMLPYVIGHPELSNNSTFIVTTVIITYWVVTLLSFKANISKFINTWGAILGIYIPACLLILLGIWYSIKFGNVNLGPLTIDTLVPNFSSMNKLSFFAGVIFIFAGLEIASVHANDIDNPKRNYPIAVFLTIGLMIIFNLICALTEANAIPSRQIELAVITQPFELYFTKLVGLPWLTNIIALMIAFGVLAQLNAWVLGPSKAMIRVAEEGLLPPIFQKRTKDGVPVTFVLVQAAVITLVTLLYKIVPAINTGFIMILMLTTVLYCIVYIFILLSGLILKYKYPEVHRSAPVPGGKFGMWTASMLAFLGVVFTIIVSVIPSSEIPENLHVTSVIFQIIGSLSLFIIPLIIYKFKKSTWKLTDTSIKTSN